MSMSKGVLNLLPSKGNVKMKGAKPTPNVPKNEKTKLERGRSEQTTLNATPKSENPEVQINRNENMREAQGSQVVLIGKLKPSRSRSKGSEAKAPLRDERRNPSGFELRESRATTKSKPKHSPKPKSTKTKSEPSPKKQKPPRVRYDKSTKRLLQQEEENKAKRKKEAKEIATKARQKAIEADKLKQAALVSESSKTLESSDPTVTQMGSFKLAGSKPRDIGKNKIGIMSYAPTISLYKDVPVDAKPPLRDARAAYATGLYQDPFTRRLEAYAKRELDPSVVSYLNTFVARNLLRPYTDRGVNTNV